MTEPAVKAFLIADLLLRCDAWQEGWVMEDGSWLILDERMPEGFIATGSPEGRIVVGQISGAGRS